MSQYAPQFPFSTFFSCHSPPFHQMPSGFPSSRLHTCSHFSPVLQFAGLLQQLLASTSFSAEHSPHMPVYMLYVQPDCSFLLPCASCLGSLASVLVFCLSVILRPVSATCFCLLSLLDFGFLPAPCWICLLLLYCFLVLNPPKPTYLSFIESNH